MGKRMRCYLPFRGIVSCLLNYSVMLSTELVFKFCVGYHPGLVGDTEDEKLLTIEWYSELSLEQCLYSVMLSTELVFKFFVGYHPGLVGDTEEEKLLII